MKDHYHINASINFYTVSIFIICAGIKLMTVYHGKIKLFSPSKRRIAQRSDRLMRLWPFRRCPGIRWLWRARRGRRVNRLGAAGESGDDAKVHTLALEAERQTKEFLALSCDQVFCLFGFAWSRFLSLCNRLTSPFFNFVRVIVSYCKHISWHF